jgi:carbamoyl-phosphate synthase large subunit
VNVLVTSAGTASAINVIKALRLQQDYAVRILAVDADPTAAGLYLADEHAIVPKCSQADYIPKLLKLSEEHQIRALYPIYSQEIEVVAAHAPRFIERGIGLLLPKPDVVTLCNDKRRMYELATTLGISTPRMIGESDPLIFPLFAKPNTASGTTGARQINDKEDWEYMKSKYPNLLYQEFVQGPEYTIDILCDHKSNLIVGSPRLRLATKSGQSVKGKTVDEPTLVKLCAQLCKAVGIVGPCNIQFIQRDDEFVFIELNPRYAAGGLMLTVHAGANLPVLALKLMLGQAVTPAAIRPGVTMLRFWEEIFVTGEPIL